MQQVYRPTPQPKPPPPVQKAKPGAGRRLFRLGVLALALLSLLLLAWLLGLRLWEPVKAEVPVIQIAEPEVRAIATVEAEALRPKTAVNLDESSPLIGIVSGHKGYDPGAVCADGLTEAELNEAIALEVINLLGRKGIRADLLEEFDPRLTDYQAQALVSVHADSCTVPGATGFKAARVTDSAIPEAEDALVACLNQEYARYTGLPEHPASITDNMTNYHAFNEIAPTTPGAIIEAGFMLEDRFLLEHRPKIVARGIAAGVLCFLEQGF